MTQPIPTEATTPAKDFTRKHKRLTFTIDSDLFEATPAIAAETLCEFADLYETAANAKGLRQTFELLTSVLGIVLLPESYTRMQERLSDRAHPIELAQISEIVEWLLGAYGLRPTQLSSPSPSGPPSPGPGTNSTASTLPAGSTFSPSPPPASST